MSRAFTFFGSFIDAAAGMGDEDRHSFMDALVAFAHDGELPEDMTPMARAVMTAILPTVEASMESHECGKRGGRPRKAPKAEKGGGGSEPVAEQDDAEDGNPPRKPPFQTPLSNPPSEPSGVERIGEDRRVVDRSKTLEEDDARETAQPFVPPKRGDFVGYFNATCKRRGIPPDSREASSAFDWYDDHGWAYRDGTPYRDWRRCVVTCVNKYADRLRERGGHGGNQQHFSAATSAYDANAEVVAAIP